MRHVQASRAESVNEIIGDHEKYGLSLALSSVLRWMVLPVEHHERITVNPEQMGEVPCIRTLRIPVVTVVRMVTDGMTEVEILEACPDL